MIRTSLVSLDRPRPAVPRRRPQATSRSRAARSIQSSRRCARMELRSPAIHSHSHAERAAAADLPSLLGQRRSPEIGQGTSDGSGSGQCDEAHPARAPGGPVLPAVTLAADGGSANLQRGNAAQRDPPLAAITKPGPDGGRVLRFFERREKRHFVSLLARIYGDETEKGIRVGGSKANPGQGHDGSPPPTARSSIFCSRMAIPAGFEPATLCLEGRCSIH
jgi:hypothetical protein